jgi:soluble lytic murein transglycosylase
VRNAGAVGDAVAGIGDQLARTGNQMIEKQDRMAYAAAKTALITADVKTRAELQNDPDYATYDKRYDAAMLAARQQASKLIQSKSDRGLFEMDAGADIERGRAPVQSLATTKRVVARKAVLNDGLETLRDTGRHATDDETHFQIVHTASELITGAEKSGDIDPLEASNLRRTWPAEYVGERVQAKIDQEDYDGAQSYLKQHRDLVDWKQGSEFERAIRKGQDFRTSISDAQNAVGITAGQEGPATAYQDPLRGRGTGVVAGGQFAAERGGKTHNGVDFSAPLGTPIYSVGQGVVSKIGHDARSGNFVIIDHGGGRTSSYAHLAGFNVKEGEEVTPDTKLGAVGMTGHTTGPHLHMVVRDGDKTVDPTKVIGQAQQSPRLHDLNQVYASIDARADREGWSVERRERAKGQADLLVKRDEGLLGRQEEQAMKSALDKVDSLGDNFTDLGQLGNVPGLSARDRITLRNMADSNKKGTAPEANSETVAGLHQLAIYNPDGFKALDLRTVRNQVTPAEFDQLGMLQAQMRTNKPTPVVVQHEAVWGMINRYADDIGLKTGAKAKPEDRQRAQKLFQAVKGDLDAHLAKDGRAPTDDEVKAAFDRQTIKLVVHTKGMFGREIDTDVRRFDVPEGARAGVRVPDNIRAQIVDSYRRSHGGATPPEPLIAQAYVENKGRLWR